ncbi:MAG: hypothetical protein DRJ66_04490 [Thermoprotei archaeon]|nr:MAG: hypothetical protein DRJ66_04490 [Thermoprotei archaeon]RLF19486.1 MAG: hypothetical protein DRZ82_05625 [Thermoprotei archaeon]
MILCVFEDGAYENFLPLTYTRPVYDLRCGMYTLRERIERSLRRAGLDFDNVLLVSRDYLVKVLKKRNPDKLVNDYDKVDDEVLMVNGRLLLSEEIAKDALSRLTDEGVIIRKGELLIARIKESTYNNIKEKLEKMDISGIISFLKDRVKVLEASDYKVFNYPWEIVIENTEVLKEDIEERVRQGSEEGLPDKVSVVGDKRKVYVSENVEIEPYVVFNVKSGPIFIDKNVYIQAGARIEGPTYIGQDTIIIGGAQIREGSNIGPVCRVGGELEESIIHGYSNKYHYGFIGHAYVGEWVNLGAGTTNSDLKNTYGTVKVTVKGKLIDTGLLKVGCTIGDMVKTSIGVLIYTGKKIGISSHVHGVITEDVPSFTLWAKSLGAKPTELYLESAIEIQRRMMARRKKTLGPEEEELIRKLFELTASEREEKGVVKGRFKL